MSEFGKQIIFKQLLDRHHKIKIPMIQRDFAQGRPNQEEVREEFLEALYDALLLPPGHELLPLNLDFIYGSVEGNSDTTFLPLDGQQRLTTLFLLHWYLSWKDDCQDEFQEILFINRASRFSYSVRPSSAEFFNELVKFHPNLPPEDVNSLRSLITNQPWYFRYWRLDPTIQSCLTMLESIHSRFRNSMGLFSKLLDEEKPVITFQLLDLEKFGLSDDLYIKMNARGKPLTAFETFKARYEQELVVQFPEEKKSIGEQVFSIADYFSRRMDNQWSNFFWSHRDKESNLYDEAVMNLFRIVALVTRDPESDRYLEDISLLRNRFRLPSYAVFHSEGWLDRKFSEHLFILLESWSRNGAHFSPCLPNNRFFDEITLFKAVLSDPLSLGYTELVQLVGYVVFMREYADELDSEAFQEWMRIVFNLTVNTTYERPADMQRSISAIFRLAQNSGNILEYFAATDKPSAGFNLQQVLEEKLKAELILADKGWRPLIDAAEGHGYFRGQVGFILDFCGLGAKWTNSGNVNWGTEEHLSFQVKFDSYLKKAENMFNSRGLIHLTEYRWERALLTMGDYLLPTSSSNYSFVVNSSTDQASWKRLLRGMGDSALEVREILHQLLDKLSENGSLENQLDEIIDAATDLEPWRQAFIETPEAIHYCEQRSIRWYSEDIVYLMKRSQMNGAHAELFTYHLYHSYLSTAEKLGHLAPLKLQEYQWIIGTEDEPHILLIYKLSSQVVEFKIKMENGYYLLYTSIDSSDELKDLEKILTDSMDFEKNGSFRFKKCRMSEVQNSLLELSRRLSKTQS